MEYEYSYLDHLDINYFLQTEDSEREVIEKIVSIRQDSSGTVVAITVD